MIKKESDLAFRIWFQSSFRNALLTTASSEKRGGDHSTLFLPLESELAEIAKYGSVSLIVHAGITSKSIKAWRMSLAHPVRTNDGVAGTNIGYLACEHEWLDVNLANSRVRAAKVRAVIELVDSVALPYFEEFRYPKQVVAGLTQADNPGMRPTMDLEYAACYGTRNDALRVLNRHLRGAPDYFHAGYREALEKFRQNGLPGPNIEFGTTGANLAFAALALGLES